jgi:hypothetical protein
MLQDGHEPSDPSPGLVPRRESVRAILWLAAVSLLAASAYTVIYPWRGLTVPIGYDTPVYLWSARYAATFGLDAPGLLSRPGAFGTAATLLSLMPVGDATVVAVLQVAVIVMVALAAAAFSATVFGSRAVAMAITALVVALFLTPLAMGFLSAGIFLASFTAGLAVLVRSADGPARSVVLAGALFTAAALSHPYLSLVGVFVVACIVGGVAVRRRDLPSWRHIVWRVTTVLAISAGAALLIIWNVEPAAMPLDTSADAALRRLGFGSFVTFGFRRQTLEYLPVFLFMLLTGLVVLDRLMARARSTAAASARTTMFWAACVGWVAVSGASVLALAARIPIPAHRLLWMCLPLPIIVGVVASKLFRPSEPFERSDRWVRGVRVAAPIAVLGVFAVAHALQWRQVEPTISGPEAEALARIGGALEERNGSSGAVLVAGDVQVLQMIDQLNWMRALAPPQDVLRVVVFPGRPSDLYGDGPQATGAEAQDRVAADYAARVRSFLDGDPIIAVSGAIEAAALAEAREVDGVQPLGDDVLLLPERPGSEASSIPIPVSTEAPLPDQWSITPLTPLLVFAFAIGGAGWTRWSLPGSPVLERLAVSPAVGLATLSLSSVLVDAAGFRLGSGGWLLALLIGVAPGVFAGGRAAWRERRHRSARFAKDGIVRVGDHGQSETGH